jgi:glutamyl endopeptidase
MIELKSQSNPPPPSSALEARAAPASMRRKELKGSKGAEPAPVSRAERALIAVGKGERITRPAMGALESIIGADDRQRILETDLAPWRMICALRMRGSSGGAAIGTGWLAGPRTVVTAGHCVHHQAFFGGWASIIEVSAGRNGAEFPFNTVKATRFSSIDRWVESADPDFDIGCIHLEEPLGDQVGWFTIASLTPAELENHMVNISGYPGDRGAGTEQWFHVNRVLSVGERRIFYDVDTMGGQSGSPVWVHEQQGAPPIVVGIHAYGTGGTPFDLGITANSAPRIIPEVFEQIEAWVKTDNATDPIA